LVIIENKKRDLKFKIERFYYISKKYNLCGNLIPGISQC